MARTVAVVAAGALLLWLGAGCRTTNVSGAHALDPASGNGVVVVSLTMSGVPGAFNMFVDFRGVTVDHKSSVPVSDLFASADWRCPLGPVTEANPCGRLAVIELREGEYEFYSWHGQSGGAPGGLTMSARASRDFAKRFKVLAGRAVYLGNIHFAVGRGVFTMTVLDLRDRDLALLHGKHPNIGPDAIVVTILD
jgi:hypothetical protein